MAINSQTAIAIPAREAGDYKYTVRQSDWQGGYNRLYYEVRDQLTEPRFWDGFNVMTDIEGEIQLAFLLERVFDTGSDVQPILATFNGALYALYGTAATMKKSTDGTTWNDISMAGGPPAGMKSYTVWRNQMVVATGLQNSIYVLSAVDSWTSVAPAAPASVSAFADAVAVSPDDKLLVWQNGVGLRSYDGTTWAVVWPPSSVIPAEATCDVLDGSTGTVIMITRDAAGSSVHEYFTPEGPAAAAYVVTWLYERDMYFYTSRFFNSAAYFGSKKGFGGGIATSGQGLLWRKERGLRPAVVAEFGDGIRGVLPSQDFGIRALVDDGTKMWIGAPQRAANFAGTVGIPGVYWYEVDMDGTQNVSPNSAIDTSPGNVQSKVYGIGVLGGDVFITTNTGIWKRNHSKRASQGYLDSSIYDLHAPDHIKSWRFIEMLMEAATSTEACAVYYRAGTLTGAWLGGTSVTSAGAKKINFPDDNAPVSQYKYNTRQIQLHLVLSRGSDATLYPRVTSIAIDAAQIKPVGTA